MMMISKTWMVLKSIMLSENVRAHKSRDITLPTKVHLVKAMVCPVVMYGCESGTVNKLVDLVCNMTLGTFNCPYCIYDSFILLHL